MLVLAQTPSFAPDFGNNGVRLITLPVGGEVQHALLRPDGKLLLSGYGYNGGPNSYQAGFALIDTLCGALDTSFGAGGVIEITHEQRTWGNSAALQPDGKIIGCGMIAPGNAGSQQWPGVFRLNADGSVDSTFNGTGYNRFPFDGIGSFDFGAGDLTATFINADSTILCTGSAFGGLIGAFRFNYDGTPDTSYGQGGAARMQLPGFSYSTRGNGLLLADSSVLVVAPTWTGSDPVIALAKFDPFGVPDSTFGTNGLAVSAVPTYSSDMGLAVQPDGRILVSTSGTGDEGFHMARFMPNGDADITYGNSGLSAVPGNFGGNPVRGRRLQLLADGSTLQFGRVQGLNPVILKRDANGALVSGFGSDGFQMTNINDGNGYFIDGLMLPSGDILAYGLSYPGYYLAIKLTTELEAHALPVISVSGSDLVTTGTGAMQWYLNGTPIGGATGNIFTPTANGDYTVEMTTSPECTYTSAPYTLLTVGLSEVTDGGMRLAGNPVTDVLVVQNDGAPLAYELLTITGQRLASGLLRSGRNQLGTSERAEGVYILRTERGALRFVKE